MARLVKPIDPIPDNLVLFYQGEIDAGRMTPTEMNQALSAEWMGSYAPNPSNRGQIEGIEGTRSNGSLIGRETGNSFTRPLQNPMSRFDQIDQREQATAADLDAQIAALGPQNLRPLPPPGGGFGGAGSGYRQGPLDTYGYPPDEQADWEQRALAGMTQPQRASLPYDVNMPSDSRFSVGNAAEWLLNRLPVPAYVAQGIGQGIGNFFSDDGAGGRFINASRNPGSQPNNSPVVQNAPYDPGFGQPRDTAPRTNNNGPDYRLNSPQTGGLSGNNRNQSSNGGGGGGGAPDPRTQNNPGRGDMPNYNNRNAPPPPNSQPPPPGYYAGGMDPGSQFRGGGGAGGGMRSSGGRFLTEPARGYATGAAMMTGDAYTRAYGNASNIDLSDPQLSQDFRDEWGRNLSGYYTSDAYTQAQAERDANIAERGMNGARSQYGGGAYDRAHFDARMAGAGRYREAERARQYGALNLGREAYGVATAPQQDLYRRQVEDPMRIAGGYGAALRDNPISQEYLSYGKTQNKKADFDWAGAAVNLGSSYLQGRN